MNTAKHTKKKRNNTNCKLLQEHRGCTLFCREKKLKNYTKERADYENTQFIGQNTQKLKFFGKKAKVQNSTKSEKLASKTRGNRWEKSQNHKKMRKNATNCKKKNVFVFSPPFQGIGNGRLIESLVIVHHSSTLTNLEIIIWHQQEVQEVLLFMNQCR